MPMPGSLGVEHRQVIVGDAPAVRAGLSALMAADVFRDLSDDARMSAELVMAEVMNNIVEHAYASRGGRIEVALQRVPRGLACRFTDSGLPMPGGTPPPGRDPLQAGMAAGDLPEGGFGWGLIRLLSEDLCYRRIGNRNQVSFFLPVEQSA